MSAIRMLALDLDGTLAARGDEVTPATREALGRAKAAGVEVVIATGRRYRTALRVVDSLGLEVPVVCLGGTLTKTGARHTLRALTFDPEDLRVIARLMHRRGLSLVGQRDSHALGGADFVVDGSLPWNPWITRYVENNAEFAERCESFVSFPREDVLVVGTFAERDALSSVEGELHREVADRFFTNVVPSPGGTGYYLEVVPAHVSKWSALLHLAEALGVGVDGICAVGDEVNDLPMIEASGFGVAMANGNERVKQVADMICGRHDEDGLVQVVEHILQG